MDLNQIIFLVILAVSLYLFISEKLSVDVIGILIILALAITGILDAKEAFSGFASEPALIVSAVFVLSAGLTATGLTDAIGNSVGKLAGRNQWIANLVIMVTVAILSAFTHHLMITAMMLPIVMRICKEHDMPSSRLLIPMATAASLGTTMTLIGAPAFLLANNIIKRSGEPALKLFSVTPLGAFLVGAGIVLILLLLWLLPKTSGKDHNDEKFRIDEVFTELVIPENSKWIGMSLADFKLEVAKRFEIIGVKRWERRIFTSDDKVSLQQGDILLVKTSPDELVSVDEKNGLALRTIKKYGKNIKTNLETPYKEEELMIVQAIIAPHSPFIGKTISEIDFLTTLGVVAIGLWRKDEWIYHEISHVRLKEGDLVILWGKEEQLDEVNQNHNFLLLFPLHLQPKKRIKAKLAAAIMLGSILVAATELLAPHIAFLTGAVLMVLTNCVSLRKAYESIEVKIFVMIAGVIPLGLAMEKTGLATLLAQKLSGLISQWDPIMIMLTFFILAGLLTQILSDAATTVLLAPIAVAFAKSSGV
ncbi:MAG: SLC13 family permease, partial [Pseudobdellovibrio sp.]